MYNLVAVPPHQKAVAKKRTKSVERGAVDRERIMVGRGYGWGLAKVAVVERRKGGDDGRSEGRTRKREEQG